MIKPKMNRIIKPLLLFFAGLLSTSPVWAATYGDVAKNLQSFTVNIIELLRIVCIVTGIGLIAGSGLRYKAHRNNPSEVRLGEPIAMLLAGIALILLSFIPLPK